MLFNEWFLNGLNIHFGNLNFVLNNTESEYLKSLWSSKVNLGKGTFDDVHKLTYLNRID